MIQQYSAIITRPTTQLYRDCLRLIQHVAGKSIKGQKLRQIVRNEFKRNADVKEEKVVDHLKSNAIRALSNYLMLQSAQKDGKLQERMTKFTESEAKDLNDDAKPLG